MINYLLKKLRKYLNIFCLANNSVFSKLLKKDFYFASKSDDEHIKLILNWYKLALRHSSKKGIFAKINIIDFIKKRRIFYNEYPETTGYILSSLINSTSYFDTFNKNDLREILNYLLKEQVKDNNGIYFKTHFDTNNKALAFDTGQILFGLNKYYQVISKDENLKNAIYNASNWLCANMDEDGSYSLNVCFNGERAYYTHATLGLAYSYKIFKEDKWEKAIIKNITWVIDKQDEDSWYDKYSFESKKWHNLHGIAYTIRGVLDCGIILKNFAFITSAKNAIDKIISIKYENLSIKGALPGHFSYKYKSYTKDVSPTGCLQFAISCFKLAKELNDESYKIYANNLVDCIKKVHFHSFDDDRLNGLLSGTWPVYGDYQSFDLPNWPIKFFLDALLIRKGEDPNNIF